MTFETAIEPGALDVRADQCSFCRKHGGHTATDPNGLIVIEADAALLSRYQFGLKSADFLVCKSCGVYAGAFMDDPSGARFTLNLNILDERSAFGAARPVSFEGETLELRRARRLKNWTPARLIER